MAHLWQSHLGESGGEIDPAYHLKARTEILPLIDWIPRQILDVGCGAGATGRLLTEKFPGCELYGIELNASAALLAQECYKHVVNTNIEMGDIPDAAIPFNTLDTVLLLDVLEHLYNPWQVLADLHKRLSPSCRIIASIPNAFNIQLLEELAAGRWRYEKWGLLDITHIRFFTEEGMRELFEQTGFGILKIDSIPHPGSMLPPNIENAADHVETDHVIVKHVDEETRRDLFSIQKLILAEKNGSEMSSAPPHTRDRTRRSKALSFVDTALRGRYLDLVRHCILGLIYDDPAIIPKSEKAADFSKDARELGRDWPRVSHSMIGNKRMLNLQKLAEHALTKEIPGDFIETGVWRGGACIMMRAVLKAYGVNDRTVWVADSFEGLPRPDPEKYPADAGDIHFEYNELAIPIEKVKENFSRYDLLDEQVAFLKGWFKDTLPQAPIEKLALMRLDGDMYESTMDALVNLFPRLSPGGFVIIDDYGYIESCRKAVHDYRHRYGITDTIYDIDEIGVFWQNLKPHQFSTTDLSDSDLVLRHDGSPVSGPSTLSAPPDNDPSGLDAEGSQPGGPASAGQTPSPSTEEPFAEHRRLIEEATALSEGGRVADAADILIGLVSAQTPVWEAYNDLAAIALQQNDLETAEQLLQQATALAAVPGLARLNLATVQALMKRPELALETLSPLLRAEKNHFAALDLVRQILGTSEALGPVSWARLLADLRVS